MKHPLGTLLYELFVLPLLRCLQSGIDAIVKVKWYLQHPALPKEPVGDNKAGENR